MTGRAAALTLLLAATGCRNSESAIAGPSKPPDSTATFTRVQREVLTPSCALSRCHAGASPQVGMMLEAGKAYSSLVGVLSVETSLLRVSPGLPNDSYLVVKLRGDAAILGARMPLGSPALPPEKLALVVDWVRRGAPND